MVAIKNNIIQHGIISNKNVNHVGVLVNFDYRDTEYAVGR